MESERLLFKFYKSYYETAKMLDDKNRLAFYDALMEKQFHFIEPNLEGLAKLVYVSQKHSIDAQVKGWIDKAASMGISPPIAPPAIPPIAPPAIQLEEEEKEKKKEKNRDAAIAATQQRVLSFKTSLYPFTKNKGGIYTSEMVKEFFEYWSELNKSKTKMKWELEKTFDIGRRLSRWESNEHKFNKNGKEQPKDHVY